MGERAEELEEELEEELLIGEDIGEDEDLLVEEFKIFSLVLVGEDRDICERGLVSVLVSPLCCCLSMMSSSVAGGSVISNTPLLELFRLLVLFSCELVGALIVLLQGA